MNKYAVVNFEGLVVNVVVWDGESEWSPPEGCQAILSEEAEIGWTYSGGVFTPPPFVPPELTPDQVIAVNVSTLAALKQLAEDQKSKLSARIGVINEAIEYEIATPEEIAELPVRVQQRKEWGQYAVYLGRVATQEGWALSVEWPAQPTVGLDLLESTAEA